MPHQSSVNSEAAWHARPCDLGSEESTSLFYIVKPGARLGWHRNSAEEIQFVVSGTGELHRESGAETVAKGDLFCLGAGERHDIRNVGGADLRILAFFSQPDVEHRWAEEAWLPENARVTRTP